MKDPTQKMISQFFLIGKSSKIEFLSFEHFMKEIKLLVAEYQSLFLGVKQKLIGPFEIVDPSEVRSKDHNEIFSHQSFYNDCKSIDWSLDVRNQAVRKIIRLNMEITQNYQHI